MIIGGEAIWAYNLDNGRPDEVVNAEIAHILARRPLVLIGCEATGLNVDPHPEYRLIRDRSTKSRANMVVFVRRDAGFRMGGWIDLDGTWARTKYAGTHEPRSFPWFWVNGLKVVGVHLPPNNAHPRAELQAQAIAALVALNPDIAVGDFNGKRGQRGTGRPDWLANAIGGRVVGDRIDCAVVRHGIRVTRIRYPERAGRILRKVRLMSDHRHAFRFNITTPRSSSESPR